MISDDLLHAANEMPDRFSNKSSKLVGVDVGVGACDGVEGYEGVGVALGVAVGDGVCVGTGAVEALVEGLREGVGVGLGFAAATTRTPLFHTNFLPDLMQVKVFPLNTSLVPTLGQELPALGPAASATVNVERIRAVIKPVRKVLPDSITQG